MPLVTAVLAVIRRRQHVPTQFWAAAVMGTIGLIVFSITRAGVGNADPIADLLIIGAVFFSAYCYVEGAILSREIAGWKVSSWIVLVTLPINIVASLIIWSHTHNNYTLTAKGIFGLFYIGVISMYFGFWFWYHGLAKAGTVRGSQVQQLQALMTLFWSAILLGEKVTIATVAAALFVIGCVAWAQIVSYRSAQ
jgi:drug/metabolite transporter (DMT)-like permease